MNCPKDGRKMVRSVAIVSGQFPRGRWGLFPCAKCVYCGHSVVYRIPGGIWIDA